MKTKILSILALLLMTVTQGATAQSPTTSGIIWDTSTNSSTFSMPAYDVEVSTELWYILIQTKCHILSGSVTGVDGNASLKYGGGASVDANSRRGGGWDDEE